jgi:glycosyltransferase involved in cell wall biosynthesis
LPIALLEAMSVGLPVISTPVGAIPEVVEDGRNGFLVEPGNSKQLAKKIVQLASNEKMRRSFGLNNRAKIKAIYDQDSITSQIADNYAKLINRE